MKTKLFLVFAALSLSLASAKTYNLKLYQPTEVGGTQLKPGEYKLDVDSNKAVIKNGKLSGEATVTVETNGTRYDATTVRYNLVDGKNRISEIRLGGTNTKLVFSN